MAAPQGPIRITLRLRANSLLALRDLTIVCLERERERLRGERQRTAPGKENSTCGATMPSWDGPSVETERDKPSSANRIDEVAGERDDVERDGRNVLLGLRKIDTVAPSNGARD